MSLQGEGEAKPANSQQDADVSNGSGQQPSASPASGDSIKDKGKDKESSSTSTSTSSTSVKSPRNNNDKEKAPSPSSDRVGSAGDKSPSPKAAAGPNRGARMGQYKGRGGFGYISKDDPRAYYSAIDRSIREDGDPSNALEDASTALHNLLQMKNLEPEAVQYLLKFGVIKFVKGIFVRKTTKGEARDKALDVLLKTLDVELEYLPRDVKELVSALPIIAAPTHPFYKVPATASPSRIAKEVKEFFEDNEIKTRKDSKHEWEEDYIVCPKNEPIAFEYLVNVNYFGLRGGFQTIINRINDAESRPCLASVEYMVKTVGHMSEILRGDYLKYYIPKLKEAVFAYLFEMHQKAKHENERAIKASLRDITKVMTKLLSIIMPEEEVQRTFDCFDLDVALMAFQSSSLERRLKGLKVIKRMIVRAGARDEKRSFTAMWNRAKAAASAAATAATVAATGGPTQGMMQLQQEEKEEDKPVDPQFVLEWVESNKIMELLFTNTHMELIRQSVDIFTFLSTHGKLKVEDLDALWEASIGRHEAEKRVIFEAIVALAHNLPLKTIDHIFSRIMETPKEQYDATTLNLLHDFTIIGIQQTTAIGKKNWYGIDTLWTLFMEAENVELADQAFEHLSSLLAMDICQGLREQFLTLCAENFANNVAARQSLDLMKRIIETWPKKSRKRPIEHLARKHRLLTVFFEDLVRYKREAAQRVEDNKAAGGERAKKNKKDGDARFSHMENIKTRLDFLQFILSNASLQLSVEQVDILWDSLIVEALVPEEREACFSWLEKSSIAKEDGFVFDEAIMQHLFVDKMALMDCRVLTRAGFNLFQRYFVAINEKKDKLKRLDKGSDNDLYVVSSDVLGGDSLWHIALDANDAEVSRMATTLLNDMHQNVSPESLKPRLGKIREGYISACMAFLAEEVRKTGREGPTDESERRIERCLALLKNFVEEFDIRGKARLAAANMAYGGGYTLLGGRKGRIDIGSPVTLHIKSEFRQMLMIQMRSNDTLTALKRKVGEQYGKSPKILRVIIDNTKELKDNDKTLADYRFNDVQSVTIKIKEIDTGKRSKSEGPSKPFGLARKPIGAAPEPDESVIEETPLDSLIMEAMHMQMRGLGLKGRLTGVLNLEAGMSTREDKDKPRSARGTRPKPEPQHMHHPAQILSNQVHFEQLYSLLEFSPRLALCCWQLMNLLPTSPKIKNQLRNVSQDVDWSSLFDPSLQFKLVYSLQVVERLIYDTENGDKDVEWCRKFVALGGGKHLVKIFMSMDDKQENLGQRQCFTSLLRIILALVEDSLEAESKMQSELFADVDLSKLVDKLMGVIAAAAQQKQTPEPVNKANEHLTGYNASALAAAALDDGSNQGDLVQYALHLLIACLISDNTLLLHFYDYKQLDEWLFVNILKTDVPKIREATVDSITKLCRRAASEDVAKKLGTLPSDFFLTILLTFLEKAGLSPSTCTNYFALTRNLLIVPSSQLDAKTQSTLLDALIKYIDSTPVFETSADADPDYYIIGLLDTLRALLRKYPALKPACINGEKNLMDLVYESCLFAIPTAENHGPQAPPKCKTVVARTAAFKMLTEVARNCQPAFEHLLKLLNTQLDNTEVSGWAHVAQQSSRAAHGYVGLQNLGATCYMNSLLQQLFLTPRFRQGIMSVDDPHAIEEEDKAESLLYQLQVLFGNLQQTIRRYCDTSKFCKSVKDMDGQPVNTAQQMDANEFFNNLFARLEDLLKGTEEENLLKEVFGGEYCNQLIPKECPHRSERMEPFYTMGIEIKNKKDINESLKLFITGEMLQGENKYKCDICDEGRVTLKRCCVSKLPKVLMLQLKRFDFDYEQMRHVKLNDRCEFPLTLNMEEYTKEYLARQEVEAANLRMSSDRDRSEKPIYPPEYYQYELVGIVVHQGVADSGHYYSFIKERKPPAEGKEPRWFEFNDTAVVPFDPARINFETFGGVEEFTVVDKEKGTTRTVNRPRTNNAYLLVYQRLWDEPKAGEAGKTKKPKRGDDGDSDEGESDDEGEAEQIGEEAHEDDSSDTTMSPNVSSAALSEIGESAVSAPKEKKGDEPTFEGGIMKNSPSFMALLFLSKVLVQNRLRQTETERERRKEQRRLYLEGKIDNIIPDRIMKEIWDENRSFLLEKYLHDDDYLTFIWDIVNLYSVNQQPQRIEADPKGKGKAEGGKKHKKKADKEIVVAQEGFDASFETVRFTTRFMMDIASRAKTDSPMFHIWVNHLKRLYTNNPKACRWLLKWISKDNMRRAFIMLVVCPMENVRKAFQTVIIHAISNLVKEERPLYTDTSNKYRLPDSDADSDDDMREKPGKKGKEEKESHIIRFMESFLPLLRYIQAQGRNCSQYFYFLHEFALLGMPEREYLLDHNMVQECVHFYLLAGHYSQVHKGKQPYAMVRKPMSGGVRPAHVGSLAGMVDLVTLLVCSCHTNIEESLPPTLLPEAKDDPLTLPKKDRDSLLNTVFLPQLVRERLVLIKTVEILKHWSWEHAKISKEFIGIIPEGLAKVDHNLYKPYFSVLVELLEIEDSLQNTRLEQAMQSILKLIKNTLHTKDSVLTCVKYVKKLGDRNERVKAWLNKNKANATDILDHHPFVNDAADKQQGGTSRFLKYGAGIIPGSGK